MQSVTPQASISASSTGTATTTTTSTATTTTTTTTPEYSQRPDAPNMQTRPSIGQSDLIKSLLNEQKTGVPPLHQAILDGDVEMAKALLASGAWVKTSIRPPLTLGNQLTATLFSLGHPTKFREAHGSDVVQVRNACIVDLAIEMQQSAPKEQIRNAGANALTLALLCGAPIDFIAHLLTVAKKQYPAIIDQADAAGRTPVMVAIERGDEQLISLLLEKGACGSSPNHLEAALNLCVRTGQPQLLALFTQISESGKQPVMDVIQRHVELLLTEDFTALSRLLKAVHFMLSDDDIARLLVAAAKIPETADKLPMLYGLLRGPMTVDQLEALREAAAESGDLRNYRYVRGRDHLLAAALRLPSAPDAPMLKRDLIRALRIKDEHFVKLLLDKGVDIDHDDPLVEEAGLISIAAGYPDKTILIRLADSKSVGGKISDPSSRHNFNDVHRFAFQDEDYAKTTSEEAFLSMLMADARVRDYPESCVDLLTAAVVKNHAACVDYLLQRGAPYHDRSRDGWSSMEKWQPIHIAISNQNLEIAKALLNAGAVPSPGFVSEAGDAEDPEFRRLFEKFTEG